MPTHDPEDDLLIEAALRVACSPLGARLWEDLNTMRADPVEASFARACHMIATELLKAEPRVGGKK